MPNLDHRFLRIKQSFRSPAHTLRILVLVIVGLCLYGVVFADYGLLRIVELRRQRTHLKNEIALWKVKYRILEDYKKRLEADTLTIEKLARQRAGLYREGEIIFLFPDADSIEIANPCMPLDKYTSSQ